MIHSYKNLGTLYLRISATFLALLFAIGLVYILIVSFTMKEYYQEANQKLNTSIAGHIASEIKPFLNGKVNKESLEHIFHNTMVLNPAVEIYLLDMEGKILSFYAPVKKIRLERVDLLPVKRFIKTNGQEFIRGDDPRKFGAHKVFSAAQVNENGSALGYIYVVLAGEEYDTIFELLMGSFVMRIGAFSILLTFVSALLIGFIVIWVLTRNLQTIINTVRQFAMGNLQARIKIKSSSEFLILANTFNEMADILAENMEKLKAMEKLKDELIANISHDLRTPLTVIQGYMETLTMKEDSISPEEKKRYLDTVMKNTAKLGKLVTDLFEISKLDSLQLQPNREAFFISELISDIAIEYYLKAKVKNIEMTSSITENSFQVFADLRMIDRVVQNLMDNAIKFTEDGGTINVIVKIKDENYFEVKIANSGRGISEEEQDLIFDRFYTSPHNGNEEGSGLGLAIVKKIMEIHQSSIEVNSAPGKGTIFTFYLERYKPPTIQIQSSIGSAYKISKLNQEV